MQTSLTAENTGALPCFSTQAAVVVAARFSLVQRDTTGSAATLHKFHELYTTLDGLLPDNGEAFRVESTQDSTTLLWQPSDDDRVSLESAVKTASNIAFDLVDYMDKAMDKQVSIGISVGPVSAGFVGQRMVSFGVYGEPVRQSKLAAGVSVPGQVWVTESAAAYLLPAYTLYDECTVQGCRLYAIQRNPQDPSTSSDRFARQLLRPSRKWLLYLNPSVETRFLQLQNTQVLANEKMWLLLGILSVFAYFRGFFFSGDLGALVGMPLFVASSAWLIASSAALITAYCVPDLYVRYREAAMVVHRLLICTAVCWDSHRLMGVLLAILGYGSAAMILNGVGFKVRFHIQLLLSTATMAIGWGFMLYNQWFGRQAIPTYLPFLHFVLAWLLPNAAVYKSDKAARAAFSAKLS